MAYKEIPLSNNFVTIVDEADYEWLSQWKWHIEGTHRVHKYAGRNSARKDGKRTKIMMHRLIADTPPDMVTDHINGDTLDNRRVNLRSCPRQKNCFNRKRRKDGSSKYKGVYLKAPGVWYAKITFDYKQMHIGIFNSEEEAALAYNKRAKELHGEFFLGNVIDQEGSSNYSKHSQLELEIKNNIQNP